MMAIRTAKPNRIACAHASRTAIALRMSTQSGGALFFHPDGEDGIMLEEMAAFDAACEAAEAAHSAAIKAAGDPAHEYGADEDNCPGCKVRVPLDDARRVARGVAWDALKASSDPLVRWIAENCKAYTYQATEVLKALPADMDALDTLAREHGWCGAWDGFRRQAEQAGVLPDAQTAVTAESEVSA